jgi:hypothetical protein
VARTKIIDDVISEAIGQGCEDLVLARIVEPTGKQVRDSKADGARS